MDNPWVWIGVVAALAAIALSRRRKGRSPRRSPRQSPARTTTYPGDFHGRVELKYSPKSDGRPDPGEIVWTWVPFEEDPRQGKDRPVLLIGRDSQWLLGLMLTSKDHDRDPRSRGQWLDIGAGDWDRQRRPSEVRLDRIIRIAPTAVRREGATVPKKIFTDVAHSLSQLHHW